MLWKWKKGYGYFNLIEQKNHKGFLGMAQEDYGSFSISLKKKGKEDGCITYRDIKMRWLRSDR